MKISNLCVNRLQNPLGFSLGAPRLSWVVSDSSSQTADKSRVEISTEPSFANLLFDTGMVTGLDSIAYQPPIELAPRTRYYWRVTVLGNTGDSATSEAAWFETSKLDEPWTAAWITPDADKTIHPTVFTEFTASKPVKAARAYVCGLGVYELYINSQKVGDELLAPFCNDYDSWLQYQTYELAIQQGAN